MSRYKIVESVRGRVEAVHSYEDLEIHHPKLNSLGVKTGRPGDFEPDRIHRRVDGDFEEVRPQPDGRVLVKKDFVLSHEGGGLVTIPSPVEGYVHYLHDKTAAMRVYDRPYGEPGAKLLAQSLHMDPRTCKLKEGERIEYGQPMGVMSDSGTPGVVHAHVEAEPEQFRKYIRDINSGVITPESYSGKGKASPQPPTPKASAPDPSNNANGALEQGEQGPEVKQLQRTLNRLGHCDAEGRALKADGDFGSRTTEALQSFQREHNLEVDGIAGPRTLAALGQADQQLLTHPRHAKHALYRDVLEKVHGAESTRNITAGPHSERLAAALTVEVIREGITRIDRIEFNASGTLARAVQANPLRDETGLNRITDGISTRQAIAQPLLESSQQAAQVANNVEAQQAELQRAETQRMPVRNTVSM